MTTFLLIRHAAHDRVNSTLCGRMPTVRLGAQGQQQAQRLAERLAALPIAAVVSSPLERALETAQPLAARLGLEAARNEGFAEIDFGEWTGQRFDDLAGNAAWQHWNSYRSSAPLPNGGLMIQVQARSVAALVELQRQYPDRMVAVVSHSDVIKAAVAHCLGAPLDLFQRIEISPASVSVVALHDWGAQVLRLNDTGDLAEVV
jgi:probable phosphoglycerate mutase